MFRVGIVSTGTPKISGFRLVSDTKQGSYKAMGQNPVPPMNIPIPTKIGSKMGGAPTNQNGIENGFDPHL